jgi:ribonuclease R
MSRKGQGRQKPGVSGQFLAEQILTAFIKHPDQLFNYKQLAKKLNIDDSPDKQFVADILIDLKKQGKIQEVYQGKFKSKAIPRGYITGTVDMTRMGYGFIVSEDEDDIFVTAKNLKTALHGDKVKVHFLLPGRCEAGGEVVEIIERWKTTLWEQLK